VIRHYRGHLSAVYSLALHPNIGNSRSRCNMPCLGHEDQGKCPYTDRTYKHNC